MFFFIFSYSCDLLMYLFFQILYDFSLARHRWEQESQACTTWFYQALFVFNPISSSSSRTWCFLLFGMWAPSLSLLHVFALEQIGVVPLWTGRHTILWLRVIQLQIVRTMNAKFSSNLLYVCSASLHLLSR